MKVNFYKTGFFFFGLALMTIFVTQNKYTAIYENAYFLVLAVACFGIQFGLKMRMKFNRDSRPFAFFCAVLLLSTILSGLNLIRGVALTYILVFLLLLMAINCDISQKQVHQLIRFFITGGFIASLMIVCFKTPYYPNGYRFSLRIGSGPILDPNFLGAYLSVATALSFRMLLYQDRVFLRVFLSGVLLLGTFLTGSRAAMLATLLSAIFTMIHYVSARKRKALSVSNLTFIILVVLVALFTFFMLPKELITRFTSSYQDGSNIRRLYLWRWGIEAIRKRWLFGYGCMEDMRIMQLYFGLNQPTHNTFLCVALQTGVLGLGAFLWMIFQQVARAWKNKDYSLIGIILNILFTSCMVGATGTLTLWGTLLLVILMNRFPNPWKRNRNYLMEG